MAINNGLIYLPAWNPQEKTDNVGVELVFVLLRKAL